jgi:hypothetical protein
MEGAGMNITVVSYRGSIDFGIIACKRSVPHAADIASGFGAGMSDLVASARDKRWAIPSLDGVGATSAPAPSPAAAS